jgi:hypothetical protein
LEGIIKMANTQFQCPGDDLGELVLGINEVLFPVIAREPNRDKIRAYVKRTGDILEDDETDRLYNERRKMYDESESIREKFQRYFGIDTTKLGDEEIEEVRNRMYGIIRRHVAGHPECRDSYFEFLRKQGEANAKTFTLLGKDYDPEERLRSLDEMYLSLMDFEE